MLNSSQEIIEKYNIGYWELFYHYIIISGELPANLINKIFKKGSQDHILRKSKHKKSFKAYRAHNEFGRQLTKSGKERAADLTYDYTPYLDADKNTKESGKRTRYRNRAYLYYFLDLAEIEYMRERINDENRQNTFIDSRQIKKQFDSEKKQFAQKPDRNFQIGGSKAYGIIELEKKTQYITYVIYDNLEKMRFKTESYFFSIAQEYLESEYAGMIFFTENTYVSNNIIQRIVSQLLNLSFFPKKEEKKLLKYFRQADETYFQNNRYLGMHIISFDETGKKQMEALKNRTQYNKKIRETLYNYEEQHIYNDEANYYDGIYNGIPCIFLYSLDVQKLVNNLRYMSGNINQELVVVCFEEHKNSIKLFFNTINNNNSTNKITYITLEELGL